MRRVIGLLVVIVPACSSSSSDGVRDGGITEPNAITQSVAIGPIALAPGEEKTVCVVVPLGNTEDLVVNAAEVSLAQGSHHLIVYRSTAAPTSTPYPCAPFTGIAIGTDTPLVFANKASASFTFPSGVGQDVPAEAMLKIEAHYINTSPNAIEGKGTLTFHAVPKAKAAPYQPADFAFWGTQKINIPAHSTASTGKQFQTGIAGTHLILITTHQHRLGTNASVWESPSAGQLGPQIANDANWSDPALTPLSPHYDFDGTNGLTYQCDWNNTTDTDVHFGESALDEMCFFGGYYYPARGLDLCIDHWCRNRTK